MSMSASGGQPLLHRYGKQIQAFGTVYRLHLLRDEHADDLIVSDVIRTPWFLIDTPLIRAGRTAVSG
jgi:hypothetical protein